MVYINIHRYLTLLILISIAKKKNFMKKRDFLIYQNNLLQYLRIYIYIFILEQREFAPLHLHK